MHFHLNVSVEVRLGELFTLFLVCPFVLFIVIVDGLDGHDFFPKLVAHKPILGKKCDGYFNKAISTELNGTEVGMELREERWGGRY